MIALVYFNDDRYIVIDITYVFDFPYPLQSRRLFEERVHLVIYGKKNQYYILFSFSLKLCISIYQIVALNEKNGYDKTAKNTEAAVYAHI